MEDSPQPLLPRRTFLKRTALAAVATGGVSQVYGHTLERHWLEIVTVPVKIGLSQPMRMAVLGDIHWDPLYEENYMLEVVDKVNSLKPDLVVLTGDFMSDTPSRLEDLCSILSGLHSTHGSLGILGNHDCMAQRFVVPPLEGVGIRILIDRSVSLPGQPGWLVTGLMSMRMGTQSTYALQSSPANSKHILLAHEPDCFDEITDPRIALQISGHTHGGQIRAPFIGPLHLPKWGKNYDMGLYRKGERQLYINRGVGTTGPSVRINCRPEITLLELS